MYAPINESVVMECPATGHVYAAHIFWEMTAPKASALQAMKNQGALRMESIAVSHVRSVIIKALRVTLRAYNAPRIWDIRPVPLVRLLVEPALLAFTTTKLRNPVSSALLMLSAAKRD